MLGFLLMVVFIGLLVMGYRSYVMWVASFAAGSRMHHMCYRLQEYPTPEFFVYRTLG